MKLTLPVLALTLALSASAAEPAPAASGGPASSADPVLDALIREALDNSPEYARGRSAVDAERERIPQASALPDPTLALGIQNDGFDGIKIGEMETSWYQIMVTQPFFWPGKRGARGRAAEAQASALEAQLERIRLSIAAEVERAYVDLLLVRGQLALQLRLEALWKEAEKMARTRYEVGEGPQSDLLRAQLERTRLAQQRIALLVNERTRVQTLNRLRVHPLDEPIATSRTLADLAAPAVPTPDAASEDAEKRSPDLAQARLAVVAAERRVDAAKTDRFPDFSVTAGIMPRGSLEPMWLVSLGVTLPVFSGSKQSRAVAESELRRASESHAQESVRQVVRLRAAERQALLSAAAQTNDLYRSVLLVQSDAAARSTLAQYQVGKVNFAGVLDVLRGVLADEGGYLESLAQIHRLAIAQREVSLEPVGAAARLASGTIPGAAAMGGGAAGGKPATPAAGGASGGAQPQAPSSGGMGGM